MNNDDASRGMPNIPRKQPSPKYQDKPTYSPSSSYNYGHSNANFNNAGYNSGNYNAQQQHPRRRVDRFRRETLNVSERLIKQNDTIIKLLKEIRDRLPPAPNTGHTDSPVHSDEFESNTDMSSKLSDGDGEDIAVVGNDDLDDQLMEENEQAV